MTGEPGQAGFDLVIGQGAQPVDPQAEQFWRGGVVEMAIGHHESHARPFGVVVGM
jgi:hypothetical protein